MAKTVTLNRNDGNLPLLDDGMTPAEAIPSCVAVDLLHGVAVNAVKLSNFGAEFYLSCGAWQKRTSPFVISFAAIAPNLEDRFEETRQFAILLMKYLNKFGAYFAIQQNFTCPSQAQTDVDEILYEAKERVEILGRMLPTVAQIPKLNFNFSPQATKQLASNKYCDALCVTNTIKWGDLPDRINWKKYFDRSGVSPLAHLGGGGLSGKPLLPLVLEWIRHVRKEGVYKPIVGGGGILGPKDAIAVRRAGASAIAVGSMSMLRPWRMQKTINVANRIRPTWAR